MYLILENVLGEKLGQNHKQNLYKHRVNLMKFSLKLCSHFREKIEHKITSKVNEIL